MRRFLQAVSRGAKAVKADPNVGADALVAADADLDRAFALATVKATLPVFFPENADFPLGYQNADEWKAYGQWMVDNDLLKAIPTPTSLTNEFLPGAGLRARRARPAAAKRSAARAAGAPRHAERVEAGEAHPALVAREVGQDLLLGGPRARPAAGLRAADELDVGQVAGGQDVVAALAVQREDRDRPGADAGDRAQPRPAALVVGGMEVDAARGDLARGLDQRQRPSRREVEGLQQRRRRRGERRGDWAGRAACACRPSSARGGRAARRSRARSPRRARTRSAARRSPTPAPRTAPAGARRAGAAAGAPTARSAGRRGSARRTAPATRRRRTRRRSRAIASSHTSARAPRAPMTTRSADGCAARSDHRLVVDVQQPLQHPTPPPRDAIHPTGTRQAKRPHRPDLTTYFDHRAPRGYAPRQTGASLRARSAAVRLEDLAVEARERDVRRAAVLGVERSGQREGIRQLEAVRARTVAARSASSPSTWTVSIVKCDEHLLDELLRPARSGPIKISA